jgi:prepilin signal peptidase PulO-like enzyme (type II secretory pathway)
VLEARTTEGAKVIEAAAGPRVGTAELTVQILLAGLQSSAVAQVWPWFWPAVAAVTGAAVASFVCVVGERLPAGRSVGGRSVCVCGRQLTWWENIPVLGWVTAGGAARCCGSRIPVRYVLLETGAAVASAVAVITVADLRATLAALVAVQLAVLVGAWQRPHRRRSLH